MHNLLQSWNVIETIATLTIDILVLGPLIPLGEESFRGFPVNTKVVGLSRLEAHHTKLYVSLCWTSGEDPSSRQVEVIPVPANIKRTM